MLVIVPNELSEAIYRKVDLAIAECPELSSERENIYRDVLAYYDKHGVIPDFSVTKREVDEPDPELERWYDQRSDRNCGE